MPTVTTYWRFAAGLEGVTDAGDHANIIFDHDTVEGNPVGSLGVACDAELVSQSERALSALVTWADWGVPVNATVTHATIDIEYKKGNEHCTAQTVQARIIDENGIPVHSNDIINTNIGTGTSNWTALSGTSRAIDADEQASSAQVRWELEYIVSQPAPPYVDPVETWFDNIAVTVTYEEPSMATPVSNIDGLIFMKGFAYASRIGGTSDAIGMAALQECSISHTYTYAEARGPESLQPLGVGVVEETLSGSIRHMVFNIEQLEVMLGGTASYSGGTGKTTYTKLVNQEPSPFNLRLLTPDNGTDLEVLVYNCLASNQPIVEGGANREFKVFGVDWRAYGQTTAQGSKLFQVIRLGNETGSS